MKIRQILIAVDQLFNTLLGGMADETISARAYRNKWKRTVAFIDWVFDDPAHCKDAYWSEKNRMQSPVEYRANLETQCEDIGHG